MKSVFAGQPRAHGEAQVDLTRTIHSWWRAFPGRLECQKALFADLFLYELHILASFWIELIHFQLLSMELLIFGRSIEITRSSSGLKLDNFSHDSFFLRPVWRQFTKLYGANPWMSKAFPRRSHWADFLYLPLNSGLFCPMPK